MLCWASIWIEAMVKMSFRHEPMKGFPIMGGFFCAIAQKEELLRKSDFFYLSMNTFY
jgi:hypothetical protein